MSKWPLYPIKARQAVSLGLPLGLSPSFEQWAQIAARLPRPPASALAVGTRVRRNAADHGEGESHKEGAPATVRVRLYAPPVGVAYILEWDDMPGLPVLTSAHKVDREQ